MLQTPDGLTSEEEAFRDEVQEFARKEILPLARQIDQEDHIPMDLRKKIAAKGWYGILWPKEYGGYGGTIMKFCLASEQLAYASGGVGATFNATVLCGVPILYYGTEAQKRKFGTRLIRGDCVAGSIGITEPDAGSDVSALATSAVREGDYWIVNGNKRHIDNVGAAELFSFWAVTNPKAEPKHRGFSTFVVEKGTPGFDTLVTRYIGLKGLECGEMHFDQVKLPAENLIGAEGDGFYHIMRLFEFARTGAGGWGVGVGQACLDEAIDYAMRRVQFGQPIIHLQGIQMMIADMVMDLELMRMLSYRAARIGDAGAKAERAVTATKLFCNEALFRIANAALQIHGANGYSEDYAVERHFRDARVLPIGEGTTQVMKLLLTKIELKSRYGQTPSPR
ncbi:MAG: acyl-CoA dehydrogenase family protein [Candidatus Binatia bacterium]